MLIDLKYLKEKYDLKIKGVIHIGAHFGQEYETYKNLGIKNILFFEPLPHVFEKLKSNVGDNAKLFQIALGNTIGEIEMNIETANQGMSSSILTPKLHKNQYPHIVFNDKITVPITKLDLILKEEQNVDYNFICIDVQGYELEVFKGSLETINKIDYIFSEVNRDEVYENCTKVNDLDEFLSKYGFERVETSWDGNIWGDAFYIKKNKNV